MAVEVILFAPNRVAVRHAAGRVNKEAIRRLSAPGKPLRPLKVIVIDDAPPVALTDGEVAELQDEAAAQEADTMDLSKPLPTPAERTIAGLARAAGASRAGRKK